ncbi:Nucleoporin nup84 [Malassezia nana]|uniref:Nuclear pore complex protein n=1 Tax=Malassezia nana TaxID=180528 RepID=A0AAF0EJ18_9BASI|nr:Nucleoporin nup84 [Malassezia nana]
MAAMDTDGAASSSFESFAAAFISTKDLDIGAQLDAESGTALVFADVCARRAAWARDHPAHDHALEDVDARAWDAEQHTWKLIHALFAARLVHPPAEPEGPVHVYETPIATVQRILHSSLELSELNIIRDWLQDMLPVQHPVEVRKGYLPFTKNALRADKRTNVFSEPTRRQRERLVEQLDPDAPLRGPGTWDVDDVHYDKALVRSLFEYVREGSLPMALDLCIESSQPWRAASLRGALFYHDPILCDPPLDEPIGNRTRSVWRRVARKAAANLSLDPYERALYGALCGDLASVLSVSESWEERLWGYINARFEQQLERSLALEAPSASSDIALDPTLVGEEPTAEASESLDSIFEQLAHATVQAAEEALDPYRIVQRAVITDSVPDLLVRVNARLPEMEQLEDHVYARLVRFFAHLALFCHLVHMPLPAPVYEPILNAYVSVLQKAGESSELVALYASSLDGEHANHVYAEFLCAMNPDASLEERRRALLQAQPHGLDPAMVARDTVDMVMAELQPTLRPANEIRAWNASLSHDERRLILAIDWLTFFEATYADAIRQANALMRAFMETGRLHAAHSLLARLPPELLQGLDQMDLAGDELVELDHWRSYFDVLDKGVAVRGLWSDAALAESRAEQHDWSQSLTAMSEQARLAHMELLELGWLQLTVEDPARQQQLRLIRRRYIPEIVLSLHCMLVDTSQVIKENLAHALALPNLVADERLRLYVEFLSPDMSQSPLRRYLLQVREAALLALNRGQNPLGGHKPTVF